MTYNSMHCYKTEQSQEICWEEMGSEDRHNKTHSRGLLLEVWREDGSSYPDTCAPQLNLHWGNNVMTGPSVMYGAFNR